MLFSVLRFFLAPQHFPYPIAMLPCPCLCWFLYEDTNSIFGFLPSRDHIGKIVVSTWLSYLQKLLEEKLRWES